MHGCTLPGEGVVLCNTSILPPLGVSLFCPLTPACSNFLELLLINRNLVQQFPPKRRRFPDRRALCVAAKLDATAVSAPRSGRVVTCPGDDRRPRTGDCRPKTADGRLDQSGGAFHERPSC